MWPFKKKPDPNNPCKWGHDYKKVKYTDEKGITWEEEKCTHCGDVKYKYGRRTIEKEYPIYMCTAPFGVLLSKTFGNLSGTFSGMLTFNSGRLSGSFDTNLEEKYIVKYLDENRLKSKVFDAETARVFIGGESLLLKVELEERYQPELYHTDKPEYQSDRYWSIHIPKLPDVEELTKTFLSLGEEKDLV